MKPVHGYCGSLILLLAGCTDTAGVEDPVAAVTAAETAFAASMRDRDFAAFSQWVADDAVFYAGERPLRGKQAVLAAWLPFYQEAAAPFSWQPEAVEALDGGRLVYSTGPVRNPSGVVIGRFNSIWRYRDGVWRVIFDKGSDACGEPP